LFGGISPPKNVATGLTRIRMTEPVQGVVGLASETEPVQGLASASRV